MLDRYCIVFSLKIIPIHFLVTLHSNDYFQSAMPNKSEYVVSARNAHLLAHQNGWLKAELSKKRVDKESSI